MRKLLFAAPALLMGMQMCAFADTVLPGTEIPVRNDQAIMLHDWDQGRVYTGHVARDVVGRDGNVAIPRGADVELIVRQVGPHEMVLDLESVVVNGRRYAVDSTSPEFNNRRSEGVGENRRTGEYVGGGALLGTIVGAIAGGGRGAAIGAVSGAAAGAGTEVVTRGGEIRVPPESVITFRLEAPLHVVTWNDPGYDRDGRHYHRDGDWYR